MNHQEFSESLKIITLVFFLLIQIPVIPVNQNYKAFYHLYLVIFIEFGEAHVKCYGMALDFFNNELKPFYFSSCYEGSSVYLYFIFSICVANYFLQIMKNFYLRLLKNNYFKLIENLHGQFRIFPYLM